MGGVDSKLAFRTHVSRLTDDEAISQADATYWNGFWSTPLSMYDIFAVVSPADVRKTIDDASDNMKTLVSLCIKKLHHVVGDGTKELPVEDKVGVHCCVRLLIRIIPFLFEDPEHDWIRNFFAQKTQKDSKEEKSLGEKLVDSLLVLLFLPGYSLPTDVPKRKDDTYTFIWETGVGASVAPSSTAEIDSNRAEALKLLLVLTSSILYSDAREYRLHGVYFTELLCARIKPPVVMALLASLINIVVQYDPVGVGVPYNYLLFADTRESLVNIAVQILAVLLDYQHPGYLLPIALETNHILLPEQSPAPTLKAGFNVFQEYCSRIHRKEDFVIITAGIRRLLNNPLVSNSTYLPSSTKRIGFDQELLVILWKLMEVNRKYFAFLLQDGDLLDVLLPILVFSLEARQEEGRQGIIHISCFILLFLSAERNFGVRLNKEYAHQCYAISRLLPHFEGTYADVLILSYYKLITDSRRSLLQMYDCMLTTIANISPYLKSLSSVTSLKLVSLFKIFTKPRFLLSSAFNYNLCLTLLETFNNLIQHQFDGNTRLIYGIIRQKELFIQLAEMTFASAQQAVAERDSEKLQQQPQQEGGGAKSAKRTEEEGSPRSSLSVSTTADPSASSSSSTPVSTPTGAESSDGEAQSGKDPKAAAPAAQVSHRPEASRWFVPTEEWFLSWKRRLPLQTVLRLLQILTDQVEKICTEKGFNNEDAVLKFLSSGTLVGLLPLAQPIMVKRYRPYEATYTWATVYLWGVLYLSNIDPPMFLGSNVQLFLVKQISS